MNRIYEHYIDTVKQDLMLKFNYKNIMEIPKISKIIIHITYKNISFDKSNIQYSNLLIQLITGKCVRKLKSKKSNASFSIRKNNLISSKVTLRNNEIYYFLNNFIHIIIPKFRDFNGYSIKQFDKHANYSLGIRNVLTLPEIEDNYYLFNFIYGIDINIVINSNNLYESISLLGGLQFPLNKI